MSRDLGRLRVGLWCLGIAIGLSGRVHALDPSKALNQYVRAVWGTSSHLPQDSVNAIAQSRDGFLWVGTEEGLARFDGVTFKTYDRGTTPAMASPNAVSLLASGDGSLWVGTYGGGLLRFEKGSIQRFGETEGLSGKTIYAMAEDGQGGLWVGTDRGLNRLRGGRVLPPEPGGAALGTVKSVLRDSRGQVWIATDQGLTRLSPEGPRSYSEPDGLPRANINGLHEDGQGVLWVATGRGLARREGDRFVTYTPKDGLADEFVSAIASDSHGALWIGTNGGLQRRLGGRFETLRARDGLPTDLIVSLLVDREDNVWVGTRGGGLVLLKEGDFVSLGRREGLASEIVDSIHGSRDGSLWVGGNGGHLARILADGRIEPVPTESSLGGSNIRALFEDGRGTLWIGTWLGLYRLHLGTVTSRSAEGLTNVRVIVQDGAGRLWVGTDSNGLYVFEGESVRHLTTRDGLPSNLVRAIQDDARGGLWIGTYGGLVHLEDGRFRTLTTADGLPSNLVRTLYLDTEGTLWIGTYGGGLGRLKNGRLEAWGTPQGLHNDVAYQILDDGRGNLWMSSNRGVFSVKRQDLDLLQAGRLARLPSPHYDTSDGLASEECNGGNPSGWRTADGRLWFLTVRGVSVVDPARLRSTRRPPATVFAGILVDGRGVEAASGGAPLELGPGRHSLEFHYTALSLADAPRLRFRYRLDGFDRDWNDVGDRRVAYYTGLPPGHYRFDVAASLDDATWSAASSRGFRVLPPFYGTPLFYAAALVTAVGIGLALQHLRVRQMRARAVALKAEVEASLAKVKVLSGLLPICAWCKQIRDDQGYWNEIESYIRTHTQAEFTHGICPACAALEKQKRLRAQG